MTHMTMTVHEALSKIKVLSKRIDPNKLWIGIAKVNDKKINGVDIQEVKEQIVSNYDSTMALIKEMVAIKKAVSRYNADTIITVAGEEMSVAEAIYMKDFGIDYEKSMLVKLKEAYAFATRDVTRKNGAELDERTEKFIAATFGSKEKVSSDEIEKAMKTFKENNTAILIDPLDLNKKIKEMEDRIAAFESSVDSAIQIANATHIIEFDI